MDIDIYIPKIKKWLQPLDIEYIISKPMKASCKQRTCHKTYARKIPLYKFVNITYKSTFVMRTNTVRVTKHARTLEDKKNFSKLLVVIKN